MGQSIRRKIINCSRIDNAKVHAAKKYSGVADIRSRLRNLAEAVMLQSLEDLWDPEFQGESQSFFAGDGFRICADIIGMDSYRQIKFLHFMGGRKNGRTGRIS